MFLPLRPAAPHLCYLYWGNPNWYQDLYLWSVLARKWAQTWTLGYDSLSPTSHRGPNLVMIRVLHTLLCHLSPVICLQVHGYGGLSRGIQLALSLDRKGPPCRRMEKKREVKWWPKWLHRLMNKTMVSKPLTLSSNVSSWHMACKHLDYHTLIYHFLFPKTWKHDFTYIWYSRNTHELGGAGISTSV